jgi:hypothetical protein
MADPAHETAAEVERDYLSVCEHCGCDIDEDDIGSFEDASNCPCCEECWNKLDPPEAK